jgi:histidinol-phosphate phosphatase family protein
MAGRFAAVFLDKDGTLVENVPYNVDPQKIKLAAGAEEGLPALYRAGFQMVVVSNQSGVARGIFPESALAPVETRLRELLAGLGVPLAGFYYCPHHPDGSVAAYARLCECRKPAPGLILRAEKELQLDLGRSWFVGDIADDVEAGRRAGCRTILVGDGRECDKDSPPDHVAVDLADAALFILRRRASF